MKRKNPSIGLWALISSLALYGAAFAETPTVDFAKEILPILSDACFQCHGPDANARKANLRLDQEDAAKNARHGTAAIVAGNSQLSELMRRLTTEDPDEIMPPPETKRRLQPEQIERLKNWIDQGAQWSQHWSFTPLKTPTRPKGSLNPIDGFVDRALTRQGLSVNPRATKETLIRRASLDLTGLPPSTRETEAFVNDPSPNAWETVIDRLLASPRYGERMAWPWLDAARYADSNGYQGDRDRTMWPWRDWVVNAFNQNLPWDQFTQWQLAGDLLPNPSTEQILATGFNRNHMINGEGGRIPEENRVDYVMDMLETTGTVWLGLTFNCCRCHDHKFDPLTQEDYYSFSAFFNQTPVTGSGGDPQTPPVLPVPTREQEKQIDASNRKLTSLRKELQIQKQTVLKQSAALELEILNRLTKSNWQALMMDEMSALHQTLTQQDDASIKASGSVPDNDVYSLIGSSPPGKVTGILLEALHYPTLAKGGLSRTEGGNFVLTEIEISLQNKEDGTSRKIAIDSAEATFEQAGLSVDQAFDHDPQSGWGVWPGKPVTDQQAAIFRFDQPVEVGKKDQWLIELHHNHSAKRHTLGCFRLSISTVEEPPLPNIDLSLLTILKTPAMERSKSQQEQLTGYLLKQDKQYSSLMRKITTEQKRLDSVRRTVPKVMVMADKPDRRKTYLLNRGLYNQPGQEVKAALPVSLATPPEDQSLDRLDLAQWLTEPSNPLMARVTVNRFWQMLFGKGLVRSPEDFGVQGERPTHPELLDWLSHEFIQSGWNVKALLKKIMISETYQRSSHAASDQLELDPANKWLARSPRYRLPSWMIRDQALAVAGLLEPALGGPPSNGYQPPGVWEDSTFGNKKYVQDKGPHLYRRSLYTFWRRIIAPTLFFDTGSRQFCTVESERTNTPLHALTTFNDITYAEAARVLAHKVIVQAAPKQAPKTLLRIAHRRVLNRLPNDHELAVWESALVRSKTHFDKHLEEANAFLSIGETRLDSLHDTALEAALGTVCLTLFNTDEALNRE